MDGSKPTVRIFLSSPGDVSEERRVARDVVEHLGRSHLLRDRVHLRTVSWDDDEAPSPLDARETPQASFNRYGGRPADCDLTIVILWGRLGTPLPADMTRADGTRYASGTVWEYEDARAAGRPVFIYRRRTKPLIEIDDPGFALKREQYEGVKTFFAALTNPDGSLNAGFTWFDEPMEFGRILGQHLEAFVNDRLAGDTPEQRRQGRRTPFLAPDLPRGFVPRPREFAALLHRVLDSDQTHPTTVTTGLQGAGGYGKTTLAIALCHEARVRTTFDGGVLWTSLGQSPRLLDELAKWYEALTGERAAFVDLSQATERVAAELDSRRSLLVIDDVWERSHLEPFLRGGARCARVVTSRRTDLLRDSPRVRVDEMTVDEALQLVGSIVATATVSEERLKSLINRLGAWPLLLRLAAGVIHSRLVRGDSGEGATRFIEHLLVKRGIGAFDSYEAGNRQDSVTRTVGASREQLESGDDRRFLQLGVFPEDEAIPLTTLQRLWALDDIDTAACAQRLDDVALVSLDLHRGVVTLHDVMHEYLQQASDLVAVHAELVAGYGDLLALPDEYAWRWLPYHLRHGGRPEDVRALLLNAAWLRAQLLAAGAHAQLRAFDWAPPDDDLELIQRALRLSLPVLVADANQLSEQLWSRLPEGASDVLDAFRDQLQAIAPRPRLHAVRPNLIGPGSLIQTLEHDALGCLVLPDGRLLSWSRDGTLRVWDLATGEGRTLVGHESWVVGARVLPDGSVLSWSWDHTLRVWDLASGDVRTLTGHSNLVLGAIVLPDGRVLSWSRGRTLRVWNVTSGEGHVLGAHDDAVEGALLLSDGRVLSWSRDATLRVWDLATGTWRALKGHDTAVDGAFELPDGQALSWSRDRTLRVWDLATGNGRTLSGHEDAVVGATPLSDGSVLSWGQDLTLRVWNVETGECRAFRGHKKHVSGALVLPDGRVVSWSRDRTLRVWHLSTGEARVLTGHENWVIGALVLPDGRILSWSRDGTLRVWDLATGEGRAFIGHESWVLEALLLPGGRVLSCSWDRTLRIWDLAISEGRALTGHDDSVSGAALLADGRILSWSIDRTLRAWHPETGEARVLAGHEDAVQGALTLPDDHVLSWSDDRTLRVWNLATGEGRVLIGHEQSVAGALALRDGRVMSWSEDGTLRVWDVASGVGRALIGHQHTVAGALELADGRPLSWSADGTLRIWDVVRGTSRALIGHRRAIVGALVLPDGGVLSWSIDRTLRVWDLETGKGMVLAGHEHQVAGALVLRDARVVSWSVDGTLRVWTLATREGQVLSADGESVSRATLLPDGRVLSWSLDRTLRLWDPATGDRRVIGDNQTWVLGVRVLADGRLLLWNWDHSIRRRGIEAGTEDAAFYLDGTPTVVLPVGARHVFVGDAVGRVHFLEAVD